MNYQDLQIYLPYNPVSESLTDKWEWVRAEGRQGVGKRKQVSSHVLDPFANVYMARADPSPSLELGIQSLSLT